MCPTRTTIQQLAAGCVAIALALSACGAPATPRPIDQPTPAATEPAGATPGDRPAPATPEPATPAPDDLARIKAAGVLLVGTSADYPPFSFYRPDYTIDGLDIALIREIARRMGVQAQVSDFAFDGLVGALQLRQVDAIIGAIAATPERVVSVDFSNTYYIGQGAVLAATDSPVGAIASSQDLARLRVGVQKGSVYESLYQKDLIDTGLAPPTNLHLYMDAAQAVNDLRAGRIDVVLSDQLPAEDFARFGGVRLVAREFQKQELAIAVRKGQTALREEINRVIAVLQADGTMSRLIQQHLGLAPDDVPPTLIPPADTPAPTETPLPETATPAPTATPACVDGMAWVADLNLDDQRMSAPPTLAPGQSFSKGWRVRNSGDCAWEVGYRLAFARGSAPGARMGGQDAIIGYPVKPGETIDLWVNMTAPIAPGVYQGFWQMQNILGQGFGQTVWVGIQVPSPPTPTPAPTQTPVAGITFTADQTVVQAGQAVTFRWDAQNVNAVYFYADGEDWQANGVAGQSSRTVYPNQTKSYYLRVVRRDNTVEMRQIAIMVQPAVGAPVIALFVVSPPQIAAGQCVVLQWNAQGSVSRITVFRNNSALWDAAPLAGSYQDCPQANGAVTYQIDVAGPGGLSRQQQVVNVALPTQALPPTAAPSAPVVIGFTVNPSQIAQNQCVTVAWNTGGGTTNVRLLRNGQVVLDNAPLSGVTQDCIGQGGSFTYQLEARNPAGQLDSRSALVNVAPLATPIP